MTDLPVRWGMTDFQKWGDPSNGGNDFEMGGGGGGLIPLYGLCTTVKVTIE